MGRLFRHVYFGLIAILLSPVPALYAASVSWSRRVPFKAAMAAEWRAWMHTFDELAG